MRSSSPAQLYFRLVAELHTKLNAVTLRLTVNAWLLASRSRLSNSRTTFPGTHCPVPVRVTPTWLDRLSRSPTQVPFETCTIPHQPWPHLPSCGDGLNPRTLSPLIPSSRNVVTDETPLRHKTAPTFPCPSLHPFQTTTSLSGCCTPSKMQRQTARGELTVHGRLPCGMQ